MSTPQNDLINSLPAAIQSAIADVEKTKAAWLAAREIESKATARVDTIKARRNEAAENAEAQNKRWYELFRANDGEMTKEMRTLRSEVAIDRESLEVFDELLTTTEKEIETIPWNTGDRAREYIVAHENLVEIRAQLLWDEFCSKHGQQLLELLTLLKITLGKKASITTGVVHSVNDPDTIINKFIATQITDKIGTIAQLHQEDPVFRIFGIHAENAANFDRIKGKTPAARHRILVRREVDKSGGK